MAVKTDDLVKRLQEACEDLGLGKPEFYQMPKEPMILSIYLSIMPGSDIYVVFDRREVIGCSDLKIIVRERIRHSLLNLSDCITDVLEKIEK